MSDLEALVWERAQSSYDWASFMSAVSLAVDSYRRVPGFQARTRLHASSIGGAATQMLWDILQKKALALSSLEDSAHFVSVRQDLRSHLLRTLQAKLLQDEYACEAMREDFLAWELGL